MSKLSDRLEAVEKYGKSFQGRNELLKHLNGERTTLKQAVKAKCYECMGYFEDGKSDCKIETCPLYPWMVYKEGEVRKSRILSNGRKKAVGARLKNARIASHATV